MTKQDMLIEYSIQDIVEYIMSDFGIDYDEAMHRFYDSVTFSKLCNIETGFYSQSSGYVYSLLCDELKRGYFTQNEI